MNYKQILGIIVITACVFYAGGYLFQSGVNKVPKEVDSLKGISTANQPAGTVVDWDFLNATTTTATSTDKMVKGAKKITWFLSRGDTTGQGNSGSTAFVVQVAYNSTTSPTDVSTLDTAWVNYNRLIDNVANTNGEELTRVASGALAAGTSTKMYSMDLSADSIGHVRVIARETTDGEHTARALIEY